MCRQGIDVVGITLSPTRPRLWASPGDLKSPSLATETREYLLLGLVFAFCELGLRNKFWKSLTQEPGFNVLVVLPTALLAASSKRNL